MCEAAPGGRTLRLAAAQAVPSPGSSVLPRRRYGGASLGRGALAGVGASVGGELLCRHRLAAQSADLEALVTQLAPGNNRVHCWVRRFLDHVQGSQLASVYAVRLQSGTTRQSRKHSQVVSHTRTRPQRADPPTARQHMATTHRARGGARRLRSRCTDSSSSRGTGTARRGGSHGQRHDTAVERRGLEVLGWWPKWLDQRTRDALVQVLELRRVPNADGAVVRALQRVTRVHQLDEVLGNSHDARRRKPRPVPADTFALHATWRQSARPALCATLCRRRRRTVDGWRSTDAIAVASKRRCVAAL